METDPLWLGESVELTETVDVLVGLVSEGRTSVADDERAALVLGE